MSIENLVFENTCALDMSISDTVEPRAKGRYTIYTSGGCGYIDYLELRTVLTGVSLHGIAIVLKHLRKLSWHFVTISCM